MSLALEVFEGSYRFDSSPISSYKELQSNGQSVLSFLETNSPTISPSQSANDLRSLHVDADLYSEGLCCINVGKELIIYHQGNPRAIYDRRIFKSTLTCHSFKRDDTKVSLLCGFSNGDICIIYPHNKDLVKYFNEEKSIDKSSVTCIEWVPGPGTHFLASFSNGNVYLFDESLGPITTPPIYELFKCSLGFNVFVVKAKSTRNPLYKFVFGGRNSVSERQLMNCDVNHTSRYRSTLPRVNSQTKTENYENTEIQANPSQDTDETCAVNHFAFSPCGMYLALVTQNGYLFVIDYFSMDLYGFMRSYFGGLTCLDWSPDGHFIAVGGQDDLITVWSMQERSVICRGQGHRSWISRIRFDPQMCPRRRQLLTREQTESSSSSHSLTAGDHNPVFNTVNDGIQSHASGLDLDDCSPPAFQTYRLGSVGHDTMLCFWNLTDDVIRQGRSFAHQSTNHSPSTTTTNSTTSSRDSASPASLSLPAADNKNASSSKHTQSPNNWSGLLSLLPKRRRRKRASGDREASKSSVGTSILQRLSALVSSSTSSSGRDPVHVDGGHVEPTNINRSPSSNSLCNDSAALPQHSALACSEPNEVSDSLAVNFFGSPMCPGYSDVPVLEPVSSLVTQHNRLTDLAFRPNTVHIVCQRGLIQSAARPSRSCTDPELGNRNGQNSPMPEPRSKTTTIPCTDSRSSREADYPPSSLSLPRHSDERLLTTPTNSSSNSHVQSLQQRPSPHSPANYQRVPDPSSQPVWSSTASRIATSAETGV